MKPATVALRDALLTALRVSTRPLSTAQLADTAPWRTASEACSPWIHRGNRLTRLLQCTGGLDIVQFARLGHDVYPHLRSLESQGAIERVRIDGMLSVYWRLQPAYSTDLAAVAELEAWWLAS